MKKYILIALILGFNVISAQKKELKKAEKLFESGDVKGASEILVNSKSLFESADQKILLQKIYLEAKIDQENGNFQSSYDKYKNYNSLGGKDTEYDNQIIKLTSDIVNSAIEDNAKNRYSDSAPKLYLAYSINPEINQDYLYYAASAAVNGSNFDTALTYYQMLKDMKYEGIVTRFFAKSVETDEEVEFSESEYNVYKKTKEYTDFREETTESRYPEIIKNIALIYAQKGENDKAMEAVKLARESDPKDLNLIITQANLYIQLNENERFEELMKEAIEQDPTNAILYFNIGVVNDKKGNKTEAIKNYKKTIELDPNFESGYLNLVSLILQGESSIVEEMNGLGNSRADNARYDVLKTERENLYKDCVPILEKLVSINQNQEAVKTLMNIYGTLGNTEGFKKMKDLVK